MKISGRVVAITGAGSGIGRSLAQELTAKGAHVALSDIDETGLKETVALVDGAGTTVTSQVLDVADRDAMVAWADQVVADHGRVNGIINNAGVAVGAMVERMSWDDFEWLMGINFWGVAYGTKAFLPHLIEAGEGHIVNVSSVFGLIGIPSQSAYNASKFGVRGFTEALRIELDAARNGVSCTSVHPGGIKTNIARLARIDEEMAEELGQSADQVKDTFDKIAMTSPEKAAKIITRAIERNQRRCLVGPDAYFFAFLAKLPPVVWQAPMSFGMRLRLRRR